MTMWRKPPHSQLKPDVDGIGWIDRGQGLPVPPPHVLLSRRWRRAKAVRGIRWIELTGSQLVFR